MFCWFTYVKKCYGMNLGSLELTVTLMEDVFDTGHVLRAQSEVCRPLSQPYLPLCGP